MKRAIISIALAGLSAAAAAAAPIDALDKFVGEWTGSGTAVATPFGKPGTLRGTTTCAWSADHLFLLCQQTGAYNDQVEHDVAVYTYDEGAKRYHFYRITPADGDETRLNYDASGAFTYNSSFPSGGKTVYLRTLNTFTDNDHYAWRTEYSTDKVHWALMNSGSVTRAK